MSEPVITEHYQGWLAVEIGACQVDGLMDKSTNEAKVLP